MSRLFPDLAPRRGEIEHILAESQRAKRRRRRIAGVVVAAVIVVGISTPAVLLIDGAATHSTEHDAARPSIVDSVSIGVRTYLVAAGHLPQSAVGRVLGRVGQRNADMQVRASALPRGTSIYALDGYRSSFRVAAIVDGRVRLFQIDTNPEARFGRDMLDLIGKVVRIDLASSANDQIHGSITRPGEIKDLIGAIESSPVAADQQDAVTRQWFFMVCRMRDGTMVRLSFHTDTGILEGGIRLPAGVRSTLLRSYRG